MSPSKGISGFDTNTNGTAPKQRRNRLLLIGIDQYEHWGKLQYPVGDCNQFFELLREHYGFGEQDLIQSLYNEQATADIIYDELYRLQESDENGKPRLSTDDNLILYFSGHGHYDAKLKHGYWVPWNAPVPERPSDTLTLVSVDQVIRLVSQLKAKHILLIVDACYPQAFTFGNIDIPHEIRTGMVNGTWEIPSRWVMTAGRLEPVPDHSFFAKALRVALLENTEISLSIKELDSQVRALMERETKGKWKPDCQLVVESELRGGEFFFHRQTAVQRTDQAPRPAAAVTNLPERLRQGSAAHLERLKKGRFKHLNIIQLLLTGNNLPDLIDTQVKSGDTETPLQQAVQSLWGREKPHAVVLGDGGMGKTVSLVRLWEDLLRPSQSPITNHQSLIPIFVALNEYNAIPESVKHDFVLRSIARNCGLAEALTDDWKNALWELLKTPLPNGSPSVLLMLDGFNEVTVKKDQLLIDLNRLSEQAKGIQMVITSRYVEIQNFTWAQHSEVIELLPLPSDKIKEYLQQVNLPLPEDEALQKLFGNPMMLTLYAGASSIAKKYEHDKRFRFLPTGSYGELLWNFNEAQLARHLEDLEHDPDEQAWHCFLLRCLVPRLANKMELKGQFFVPTRKALNPAFNFKTLLDEAFTDLNREELTEVFPELDGKRSLLGLGELQDLDAREQRSQKVLKYLVEKLHLLVTEDEALRFVHQNFRDFFAASHLRNVAEMALVRGVLPEEWKERAFLQYLLKLIGEIEGEHNYRVYFNEGTKQWQVEKEGAQTLLSRILEKCRGEFDGEKVGFTVWNILISWMVLKWELTGFDLSRLWLKNINFNGTRLSRKNGKDYLATNFAGSIVDGEQFCFRANHEIPTCLCPCPDGKNVLAGFADGTIKEIDLTISKCVGQCRHDENCKILALKILDDGEFLSVESNSVIKFWSKDFKQLKVVRFSADVDAKLVCFSPCGRKLVVAFEGGRVQEFEVSSGEPTNITFNYSNEVRKLSYDNSGENIFIVTIASQVIRIECSTGTEVILTQLEPDKHYPIEVSNDGKIAFSGNRGDGFIQWDLQSAKGLKSYDRNSPIFGADQLIFSPDGSKFLAPFVYGTFEEWDIKTGHLVRNIHRSSSRNVLACYRQDGKSIITASYDGTIYETDLEQNIVIGFFKGFEKGIKNASFFPDEQRVLLALDNHELQEWSILFGKCIQSIDVHPIFGTEASIRFEQTNPFVLLGEFRFYQLIDYRTGRVLLTILTEDDSDAIIQEMVNRKFFDSEINKFYSLTEPLIFEQIGQNHKHNLTQIGQIFRLQFFHTNPDKTKVVHNLLDKNHLVFQDISFEKSLIDIQPEIGMLVQSIDFRHLHPSSQFTEEEKERLRRYGAIFTDEDERRWKEAVAEAYSDLEDDEPEKPPQP